MLLAIDVGNTETTIGVFDRDELVQTWRMATIADRTPDELALVLASFLRMEGLYFDRNVSGVAVACVVPRMTQKLRQMVQRYFHFEPLVIEAGVKTGMPVKVDNPREVGADRIVIAVAALEVVRPPLLVIGCGTATTFNAVDEDGEYLGGAIAPGLDVAANALASGTAMLRRVEYVPPPSVIGRNTAEALQSGLVLGWVSLIEGMVDRFRKELGADMKVVLTGGLSEVLGPHLECVDHMDPWLVLQGLRILFDRNTA